MCVAVAFALMASLEYAEAQQLIKIKMGRLGFPSMSSILIDVVAARGFDKKNGLDMEVSSFAAVSAHVAALATGEVEMITGGPHTFQKLMTEGVPIRITLTWARLNALAVITNDPSVKDVLDLKGKSIAADIGSSEYQILSIYGRSKGIIFGKDVTVVQASPPLARAQLQASRVEAAMLWEPTTTVALRDNANYRVILTGDQAWKAVANATGWELVFGVRDDFLKRNPTAVPKIQRMLRDAQEFIETNTDEADEIVVGTIKLPKGVLREAVKSGRLVYEVVPAWEAERPVIENMLKVAVDIGYMPALPANPIYTP
jgi:ABC-type nitrate/sulfonate/bicarbonate transport system substrate-binding protein